MGSSLTPTTMHHHHHDHDHEHRRQVSPNSAAFSPTFFTSLASFYNHRPFTNNYIRTRLSICYLHRSFPLCASNPRTWSHSCRATSPGPPSSPKLDPPPGDNPASSSGVMSRFSRVQDAIRIFFAVLFWMSLFFWSCVWDGRNDGRPNNDSRFRR